MTIEIPESFRSALESGAARTVCDAEAGTASALYGRALARMQAGRDAEARSDLEAALPEIGDAARVELAFLDLRQRTAARRALAVAAEVAERAKAGSALQARALHVQGLALGKLRRTREAADALLRALDVHRGRGDRRRQAEVYDTLGTLFSASGQLESAAGYYALSLVEKTLSGDRYGAAITLGNLGRLHLRAGRFREAIDCFELDLRLAEEIGDDRGRCRMRNDLGRARLGLEDLEGAERELRDCLELASRGGYPDLVFFANKDFALVLLERARSAREPDDLLRQAEEHLREAERALGGGEEPYLEFVLQAARGQMLLARGDRAALEALESAARAFAEADLPDLEIATLVSLAEALCRWGYPAGAERCLVRAMARARKDGFARYLPAVREAMLRLEVVESAVEEKGRLALGGEPAGAPDGYTGLRRIGSGAFGDVFRALDPRTHEIVAIKCLRDAERYDPEERRRLLATIRLEMEAASRIRHPGIARVLAIGTDAAGRPYVVQEFVEGEPLRRRMPKEPSAPVREVLATARDIAGALQELHSRGIFHRDLKPENVILRAPSDRPVLIDFGIAYVPGCHDALGPFAGTLVYMSPEQARGQAIDGRTDVYALGVLCYEWLTGARPLLERPADFQSLLDELCEQPPVPLLERRPDLDRDVARFVESLLAKNRRKRPTASEVAEQCAFLLEALQIG